MDAGTVRVFDLVNNLWTQRGQNIFGDSDGDSFGESVSISGNGQKLIIGAKDNDSFGNNSGHSKAFIWNGSLWEQLGSDVVGEALGDYSESVSFSRDGNIIAIGEPGNDDGGSGSQGKLEYLNGTELIGVNWVLILMARALVMLVEDRSI